MGKNLILLTNAFPYGNWEPYLETEVQYYDTFESIHICSLQIRKEQLKNVRQLPSDKFSVCAVLKARGYVYLLYSFIALLDRNLYKEVGRLIRQKRLSFRRLVKLFIYISRSHYESKKIVDYLKKKSLYCSQVKGIIYSYRFEYQPYVGLLIQKYLPGFKIVARGHRYDLYEEKNSVAYIPMRELLMQKLDKIFMVSDDGAEYLTKKYPSYRDKIIVSRLGTIDHGEKKVVFPSNEIYIVSCSNVVPVKRINLIIKSLQLIDDIKIRWTHYGNGEDLEKIKTQCKECLSSNIIYDFRGYVPNNGVLNDYSKEPYHLFLNVSSSEGIPVSIMEAISFGIPCIATDVGGTNEIISNKENGILLPVNFTTRELADQIEYFVRMSPDVYQEYRKNARIKWERNYNADLNYRDFVTILMNII